MVTKAEMKKLALDQSTGATYTAAYNCPLSSMMESSSSWSLLHFLWPKEGSVSLCWLLIVTLAIIGSSVVQFSKNKSNKFEYHENTSVIFHLNIKKNIILIFISMLF